MSFAITVPATARVAVGNSVKLLISLGGTAPVRLGKPGARDRDIRFRLRVDPNIVTIHDIHPLQGPFPARHLEEFGWSKATVAGDEVEVFQRSAYPANPTPPASPAMPASGVPGTPSHPAVPTPAQPAPGTIQTTATGPLTPRDQAPAMPVDAGYDITPGPLYEVTLNGIKRGRSTFEVIGYAFGGERWDAPRGTDATGVPVNRPVPAGTPVMAQPAAPGQPGFSPSDPNAPRTTLGTSGVIEVY